MEYLADPDVKEDADIKEDPDVKEDPEVKNFIEGGKPVDPIKECFNM